MNGSENGRGSASSLISRANREPRTRSAVSWSEFLPRYLLIEEALKKRNVLEVGTLDIRSLMKLHDSGCARVLGTAPDPARFDRGLLRGRSIDVLRMESGRLDFGDAAFDAILVVDLAQELAHNRDFLFEVRRILRPDGFAAVGYAASGRSLVELIDDEDKILALDPAEVEGNVRAVFPDAHFYVQSPFVGVTIHPQDLDPSDAEVSLDPSLASVVRPSHVLALCGRAPEPAYRTLVELPFVAFEAMTDAAQERNQSDFTRLIDALRSAREQIALRDRSLSAIKARLPKIREAIAASRVTGPVNELLPSPTVLDRPTEGLEDGRMQEMAARIASLEEALHRERSRNDNDTIIQDADTTALEHEIAALKDRERELEADLDDAIEMVRKREEDQADLMEARRRITQLERTASLQEQEIDELRRDLEGQSSVRHSMGDEYRDAESRIAFLNGRIEDLALGHLEEMKLAEERILFLTDALSLSDQERDGLRAQIDGLEEALERSDHQERDHRFASEELEVERAEHYQVRNHFDTIRVELHEKASEVDRLERAVADRDAQIALLKKDHSSSGADRKAVELAAAHLGKEVETLRKRVQELRNERDTLAATSRLLLEERDTAAHLARRAVEAEHQSQQLLLSLEGGQAAIERLERELDEATVERDAMEQRYFDASERLRMLEKDLERNRISSRETSGRLGEEQSKQRELDKKLAELAQRVNAAEVIRDRALRDKAKIEELMLEAHQEVAVTSRDVRRLEERIAQLQQEQKSGEQEIGRVLSERARAEAEATRARALADDYRGKNALLVAELADVERSLSQLKAQGSGREMALSKTLSQAADLDARVKDLERLAETGERERIQIENQRHTAEQSRRSAEAARSHAIAEVRALTVERAELVARYESDLLSAQRRIVELEKDETLQREIENLEAERLALMVWAEELEISRKLAEANVARLRTDSARHQVASEEAQDEAMQLDLKLRELEAAFDGFDSEPYEREHVEARLAILQAENARLRHALVATKDDLASAFDRIDMLELKNAELARRLTTAETRAHDADQQLSEAVAWLEATEQRAAESEAKLSQAATELLDVDERLHGAHGEMDKLRTERAQLEEKNTALLLELKQLARLEELDREALELRGELAGAQAEIGDLRSKLDASVAELGWANSEGTSLRSKLHQGGVRIAELEGDLARLRERLASAEGNTREASLLAARLEKVERKATEVTAALAAAQLKAASADAALHEASELRARVQDAQRRTIELESKVKEAETNPGVASLEDRATRAEQNTARMEAQLAKEASAVRDAETRARNAEVLARNADERSNASDARRRTAEARAQDAEAKSSHAERKAFELEHRVKQLEQQLLMISQSPAGEVAAAPLRKQMEEMEQCLDEARVEVGRKLGELRTAKEERMRVERELEAEKQKAQSLEEKLSRQGDTERLKDEVDQRDQKLARYRADAASMMAEKSRLRALIQSSEQNQVQLERRIAELETSLAESNQQVDLLRRDLNERTERLRRLSSGINEPG